MLYTSTWPSEDGENTLIFDFLAESDAEAIEAVMTGDMNFCDLQELPCKSDWVTIRDENDKIIYNSIDDMSPIAVIIM